MVHVGERLCMAFSTTFLHAFSYRAFSLRASSLPGLGLPGLSLSKSSLRTLGLGCAISLGACGGGAGNGLLDLAPPIGAGNSLVCSSSGGQGSSPADAIVRLFATVYELEAGNIDELGAFIRSTEIIFILANNYSATVDGTQVPIDSACYQLTSNQLVLQWGQTNAASSGTLTLSSGRRAAGSINGKAVRTKP